MRPNSFTVISIDDEAIDTESMTASELHEYTRTRDIKLLQGHFHPGMQPTKYNIRAVPHSLWQSYVDAGGDHIEMRYRRAFICGIESVENWRGDDGIALVAPWKPTKVVPGTNITTLTEDECNEKFSPAEVLEIGSVIYQHSFLARRKKLIWQLPLTLYELLASRKYRPAESNQSTARTQTSSQHSGEAAPKMDATANQLV